MPIYLHEKYAKNIDQRFTEDSFVAGKSATDYDWDGVEAINILGIESEELNDYQRSGSNRYGTPKEVQDTKQRLAVTQDKSFALTCDKGNNTEQSAIKEAGKVLNVEMEEKVVPTADKYVLKQWCMNAGKSEVVSAALTKATLNSALLAARSAMRNASVPLKDLYCYLPSSQYSHLLENDAFIGADALNKDLLSNGIVGKAYSMLVCEIPDDYLPTGINFLVAHKKSVLFPKKIWDTKIHIDPPGLSGNLLEGRFLYDGFVKWKKAGGVYVNAMNTAKVATPTHSGTTLACTTTGATYKYTIDGTDPRYSASAIALSTTTLSVTVTTKVVAIKADMLPSDILTITV